MRSQDEEEQLDLSYELTDWDEWFHSLPPFGDETQNDKKPARWQDDGEEHWTDAA